MIYLVEDDESIRELISYSLNKTGMPATGFATPAPFWLAMEKDALPDLILLDIMLPEQDGLSILHALRTSEGTRHIPVIMLTAKSAEFDKVTALDGGADDYITKPFGVMELLSRIKAVLRRSAPQTCSTANGNIYTVASLTVSCPAHTVTVGGAPVTLTFKEFELLTYLLEHRGTALTRDQILQGVWGYAFDGENRTVDVHVRSLRLKLGTAGELIETVRGIGYKIGAHT